MTVTLEIPFSQLKTYLRQRVTAGVQRFYRSLLQAFQHHPSFSFPIHILLAGNGSRNDYLQPSLQKEIPQELQPEKTHPVRIVLHPPLDGDPSNPNRPTAKTGVALGLLRLIPGEPLLIRNLSTAGDQEIAQEAPFLYYIGTFRRRVFQCILGRNDSFAEWKYLGKPVEGVLILGITQVPEAVDQQLLRESPLCHERRLWFEELSAVQSVFVRIIGPSTIEIGTAGTLEEMQTAPNSLQEIKFNLE